MNPRDKSRLYHDLGQLIRSGMTLPRAVEKLAEHSRGRARSLLHGIGAGLAKGDTVAEAVARLPQINELDTALFAASERAGKLDRGFDLAADYYNALAEARSRILRKTAYPLFVLHLGVVAFSLTRLMGTNGSIQSAGEGMLIGFACLWGALLLGGLLIGAIRRKASRNVALDRSLGMIPLIGGMRRDLALSRFSAAYDMQLEAGVNVLGALEASGRASASANYRDAVDKALPDVRSGGSVSAALVGTRAFPDRLIRAFMVGEESGQLDHELRAVSEEYRSGGLRKMEMLSEWIPRFIFIAVAVWIGWQTISFYMGYVKGIQEIISR
jgi:type II secretory pathway component PulF